MTDLDNVFKSRDMTLLTKFHLVKAMVFPVVMYGYESWTIKKAEHQKIDSFELWCWRRLLRVCWTTGRSNQSILVNQPWIFIGRSNAEAEVSILWPPDAKNWLIGKDPDAGKDWLGEGWQRMRRLGSITESMDMNLKNWEMVVNRGAWWSIVGIWLGYWTTTASWMISHTVSWLLLLLWKFIEFSFPFKEVFC